jgi:hypothetical protein
MDTDRNTGSSGNNRFDHSHVGIADEARKAIGCDAGWSEGDCFDNLPEMNDHDPCGPCHLSWRIACFEHEATEWWHALGVDDGKIGFLTAERNNARAAYRALADTIRHLAPTSMCLFAPAVVEAAGVTDYTALDDATEDVADLIRPLLTSRTMVNHREYRIEPVPHLAGGK